MIHYQLLIWKEIISSKVWALWYETSSHQSKIIYQSPCLVWSEILHGSRLYISSSSIMLCHVISGSMFVFIRKIGIFFELTTFELLEYILRYITWAHSNCIWAPNPVGPTTNESCFRRDWNRSFSQFIQFHSHLWHAQNEYRRCSTDASKMWGFCSKNWIWQLATIIDSTSVIRNVTLW